VNNTTTLHGSTAGGHAAPRRAGQGQAMCPCTLSYHRPPSTLPLLLLLLLLLGDHPTQSQ